MKGIKRIIYSNETKRYLVISNQGDYSFSYEDMIDELEPNPLWGDAMQFMLLNCIHRNPSRPGINEWY